ncbi:MAG: serine/threonine-protein phosphatase [Oscillospiraceae bacterium]|nr:serine/threonine-protein phosphatase [Oscillospiraceae bacterium]
MTAQKRQDKQVLPPAKAPAKQQSNSAEKNRLSKMRSVVSGRHAVLVRLLAQQSAAVMAGFLLARSSSIGGLMLASAPFAIALAAAGPIRFLGSQVLGSAIGCLLLLPYPQGVAAMAAVALAGLGNLALQRLGLRRAAPFCAFICALASGFPGLAEDALLARSFPVPPWLFVLCGGILSGCCAYFIYAVCGIRALPAGAAPRRGWKINRQQCAAMLICAAIFLTTLGGISIGPFAPARVIGALIVLAAAYCWQESGGAAAGACVGAAMALAGGDLAQAGVFAFGGLLAGVFSQRRGEAPERQRANASWHKSKDLFLPFLTFSVAGGFALVCVLFAVLRSAAEEDAIAAVVFTLECTTAILLFIAVPSRVWDLLRQRFVFSYAALVPPAGLEAGLRLTETSDAVRRISAYVEEVARGLEQLCAPLEHGVCARTEAAVCADCPEHSYCWREKAAQTADFFSELLRRLRETNAMSVAETRKIREQCGFGQSCRRVDALCESLERAYFSYTARADCHQKAAQLRQSAAEQFNALADLLDDLCDQLTQSESCESETAEAAARALEEFGHRVNAVSCVRDASGIAVLTARLLPAEEYIRRETLTSAVRRATGLRFDLPSSSALEKEGGEIILHFKQQPQYHITLGAVQMSSSSSVYCGDYFDCFSDGRGHEMMILSDGMGTGGRAAVDSALATEIFSALTRSGLRFACAMRIVNAALLVKSCDETLATLDAAGIDLYTGEVEFCKAGGAASFLRRGGRATQMELSALPAGILRQIRPAEEVARLDAEDIVVLVSDGMLSDEDSWLCGELELWTDGAGDMQALAEHLAATAVQRRAERQDGNEREDDLTVICAQLHAL